MNTEYTLRPAKECSVRGGLSNFFHKLDHGKTVKIAYFGGSITAQSGWRCYSLKWFQQQFSQANVKEIQAAIGGTASDLGVFRVDYDVLRHKPDLIFIEFAVNDFGLTSHQTQQNFDGIIRKIWRTNPRIDICFVYTLADRDLPQLQNDLFPQTVSVMEVIADYYRIPSIHMGYEVAKMTTSGKVLFKCELGEVQHVAGEILNKSFNSDLDCGPIVFSGDGVHPYPNTGHWLYHQALVRSMDIIRHEKNVGLHELSQPYCLDNKEYATQIQLNQITISKGWKKLDPQTNELAGQFKAFLPELYCAQEPGEYISFKFKGTYVAIYDLIGPSCGQLKVTIDGKTSGVIKRIDEYCVYYRIALGKVAECLEDAVHEVKIEIDSEVPDKRAILFESNWPAMEKSPEKFEGTNWYLAAIDILGEIIE